jgi:hypothetical protein
LPLSGGRRRNEKETNHQKNMKTHIFFPRWAAATPHYRYISCGEMNIVS